jgi:hypothetical protein
MIAALATIVASSASADGTTYPSLPSGSLAPPRADAKPAEVGVRERVAGVFATTPHGSSDEGGVKGVRYVSLFSNLKDARAQAGSQVAQLVKHLVDRTMPDVALASAPRACFTVVDHWQLEQLGDNGWPMTYVREPSMHGFEKGSPAEKQFPEAGVRAVRREQLVVTGDAATLEGTDFWLDPGTLGARPIQSATLPLERLASGPGGVHVFAARDEDQAAVHFVVQMPDFDETVAMHLGRHAQLLRGDDNGYSDCGHARMRLRAAPGSGEMATMQLDVVVATGEPEQTDEHGNKRRELRVRSLVIHVGLSQDADGAHPVPTVSFGWVNRERRLELF